MEQHPVPQHIASYEFHLVGDMTLKQFGFLAGGIAVALLFYATPLPPYFKWPGIVFCSLMGFALAFIPIQERPLSVWLVAFAKAIFSPTQYIWEKKAQEPEILKVSPAGKKLAREKQIKPPDQDQLAEYLKTLPAQAKNPIEQREEGYLRQVNNLFQLIKTPPMTTIPSAPTMPPSLAPIFQPPQIPLKTTVVFQPAPPPLKFTKPVIPLPTKITPRKPPAVKTKPAVVLPEKPGRPPKPTVGVKTSTHLPIPSHPNQPNILVGMVLDKNNELIEGALLEIRNSKGIAVRALKTNKLGQFRIAYPLQNDTYEIETEKEGYQFDIIKIEVKGKIILPIEIRAK